MNKNKRDFIGEIKSMKARSEFNSRYDYSGRLHELELALEDLSINTGDYNNELLKYIPVATVACFEAFFRSTIKELIDFGKPFSDRVAEYDQAKFTKLNFQTLAAVQTKTLTVGEFVAHILSYSSLLEINSNISVLIETDFLKAIRQFEKRSIAEHVNALSEDFKKRADEIIKSIFRTYELRNIFCHEFATNVKIDKDEIISNYKNCKVFLEHADQFMWNILYPNAPETQTDMNLQASDDFAKADDQLDALIELVKRLSSSDSLFSYFDIPLFEESNKQWKKYRELCAKAVAYPSQGGTMYPLLYTAELTRKTKEKIKSLEDDFEILLRKNNYF